jgi:hypothetical protein
LESKETSRYQVEYTTSANNQFYKAVDFFYRQHTLEKAEQMVDELEELAQSLEFLPSPESLTQENVDSILRDLPTKKTKK